jgi:hypothetical protein
MTMGKLSLLSGFALAFTVLPASFDYANADYDTSGGDVYIFRGNYISEADAVAYCAQLFRSYDVESRTFLAKDGRRVSCPQ